MRLERRHEALAVAAMECDDHEAFRAHMLADVKHDVEPSYPRVMWGPRTGYLADAALWNRDFRKRFTNRITLAVADGELAAARGDWPVALDRLEEAWKHLRLSGEERAFTVAEHLADVHAKLGRPDRALQLLESTVALKPNVYALVGLTGGKSWIRAQAALAARYRATGHPDKAAEREAAILPLLSQADPGLPLLARLRVRQSGLAGH